MLKLKRVIRNVGYTFSFGTESMDAVIAKFSRSVVIKKVIITNSYSSKNTDVDILRVPTVW